MSRALSGLLFVCLLIGCRTPEFANPSCVTGKAAAFAGSQAASRMELRFGGVLRDREAESRMYRVARRLASNSSLMPDSYRFRLLASGKPNAFSLPGGFVYVTQGLYAELRTDGLLAAVLAHEMAHIETRDGQRPRTGRSTESLDRELAADALAVGYLNASGLSSASLVELILLVEDAQPHGWAQARADRLAHRQPTAAGDEFTHSDSHGLGRGR